MADTQAAKSESKHLNVKEQQREQHGTSEQIEQQNLSSLEAEVDAEEAQREEGRIITERNERQDLNQGMQMGTRDSIHRGITWGPSYRVRTGTSRKQQNRDESNKTPKETEKKPQQSRA